MKLLLFFAAGLALFIAIVWIVRLLWNWLIPVLFKGPRIRFIQAIGIVILSKLLFGFPSMQPFHHPYGKSHQQWNEYSEPCLKDEWNHKKDAVPFNEKNNLPGDDSK